MVNALEPFQIVFHVGSDRLDRSLLLLMRQVVGKFVAINFFVVVVVVVVVLRSRLWC